MYIARRVFGSAMLVVLCSYCAGCANKPPAVMQPEITLSVIQQQDDIRIDWKVRNNFPFPIWLPNAWSGGWEGWTDLPHGFLTPDGEIAFVFGILLPGVQRTGEGALEWSGPRVRTTRVRTGESVEGVIILKLPYRPTSFVADGIPSTYDLTPRDPTDPEPESGTFALPPHETRFVVVQEAKGVYLGFEYWLCDPNRGDDFSCELFPGPVGEMLRGEIKLQELLSGDFVEEMTLIRWPRRLVVSDLVRVRVPLAKPAEIHRD